MSMKSILKLLADMNKKEPYLATIKDKTLDLVSSYQPMFMTSSAPIVRVGTRVFYSDDKKTIYLLFKYYERILVYGAEYDFQRSEEKGNTPDHLYVLRERLSEDEFRDVLVEDDEEYLHELFDLVTREVGEKDEAFLHRNTIWLLDMPLN